MKGLRERPEAAPHFHGHRERLKERFREAGADALPDYELLELVLFQVLPRQDTKPLAKQLLEKFGNSFVEVINAPRERLKEVKGVGDAAVDQLKIVRAAALRFMQGSVVQRSVRTPDSAFSISGASRPISRALDTSWRAGSASGEKSCPLPSPPAISTEKLWIG